MRRMGRIMDRGGHRGIILVGTYFFLAFMVLCSGSMAMQLTTQQLAGDRLRARYRALDLAQGATEQLREDLFQFLTETVSMGLGGDPLATLAWLDGLDPAVADGFPAFDIDSEVALDTPGVDGLGISAAQPRTMTLLPALGAEPASGSAWIVSVVNTTGGNTAPRNVVIRAAATQGGVTKQIQTTFTYGLGASNVFRYAYFVNNYGWFDVGASPMEIDGEVRANGNLRFTGTLGNLSIQGDLSASVNPDLHDPTDPLGPSAAGDILGDPYQLTSWTAYWNYKRSVNQSRPAMTLSDPAQPTLGIGGQLTVLPKGPGQGWDSQHVGPIGPRGGPGDQQKFPGRLVEMMPYLGGLTLYKTLANQYPRPSSVTPLPNDDGDGTGSSLRIRGGSYKIDIDEVYKGPDGIDGTIDDKTPVILIGTNQHPIELNGPVVIPGDVIIRGRIRGKGTIYAGRNMHLVGSLVYAAPPKWPVIERDQTTGRLREYGATSGRRANLGTVDNGGTYTPP